MDTILLVDDEKLVRRSLEKTLLRAGFDVITAGNCTEGFAAFEDAKSAAPVTLAILDLNMPGFNGTPAPGAGMQLLSRLREKNADLKIVVLTAYDEVYKAKDAIQEGASSYFVKGREQGLVEFINKLTEN
ncbi:MAG: response regulator [Chloroflexota bacterium]|nr:response regulator [Chloroflexota bacterium]